MLHQIALKKEEYKVMQNAIETGIEELSINTISISMEH